MFLAYLLDPASPSRLFAIAATRGGWLSFFAHRLSLLQELQQHLLC